MFVCAAGAASLEISAGVKRSHLAVFWPPNPDRLRIKRSAKAPDKRPGSCLPQLDTAASANARLVLFFYGFLKRYKREINREREEGGKLAH